MSARAGEQMASGARQVRYTNVYVKTVHHENFGVFVGKRVDVQIQNHGLMFSGALHLPFKSIAPLPPCTWQRAWRVDMGKCVDAPPVLGCL